MIPRHRVSRAAIDMIKRFEGYRPKAAQTPDGRWTIGYGHTRTARAGAQVSEQDAEALLLYDIIGVSHAVNEWVYAPLNQNQFDALCAFVFNIGAETFRGSHVLRRLNEGALLQAAAAMELWRKAQFEGEIIVVDALIRRRAAEKALFLTPPDGVWIAAPSPLLPPQLDADSDRAVPRQAPAALSTALEGDRVVLRREPPPPPPSAPLTPIEDEGASPLQKATASVTGRLQNLFRTPERRPPPPPVDFGRAAEALRRPQQPPAPRSAEQPVLKLTPPDEDEASTPAGRRARLEVAAANEAAPGLFDTHFSSANDQAAVAPAPAEPVVESRSLDDPSVNYQPRRAPAARSQSASFIVLVSLAVAGLAVFAGSLYWFFSAWGGVESSPVARVAVWIASFAGVACFAVAAYLMLERLARASGDLGAE